MPTHPLSVQTYNYAPPPLLTNYKPMWIYTPSKVVKKDRHTFQFVSSKTIQTFLSLDFVSSKTIHSHSSVSRSMITTECISAWRSQWLLSGDSTENSMVPAHCDPKSTSGGRQQNLFHLVFVFQDIHCLFVSTVERAQTKINYK